MTSQPSVSSQSSTSVSQASASPSHLAVDREWHRNFAIPEFFSSNTEKAIASGRLTRRNRTEIIQSLSSSMMVYTKTPTSEQYCV